MDEKPSSPANARSSMIGSAFAVVKNYFTPERAAIAKTNQSVGITPLARSFATLTLDDSSHDSTGSFRTTFSQQDDSFQSTASHVDLLDEYNETAEHVADQTVLVEETLLDSSVSSFEINCTVNDGIDDSVILVSDSNDSPQIVFDNVAKKSVIVNQNVHDISANISNEYHKNLEDILDDVNDDGSLLSDIIHKYDSSDVATDIDNRSENKDSNVIEDKIENQIKTDSSAALLNKSIVVEENISNIGTPAPLKSESVNNFSPIFIPEIVVTQVANVNINTSPVSDLNNSFDTVATVELCDNNSPADPNGITYNRTLEAVPKDSACVEQIKENVESIVKDLSLDGPSIIGAESQNDAPKGEIIEDQIVLQNSEITEELPSNLAETSEVLHVKEKLNLDQSEIGKCGEDTFNETSQLPSSVPLNVTADISGNFNDSLISTSAAAVIVDASLNITNAPNNTTVASLNDKMEYHDESLSAVNEFKDLNVRENTIIKDIQFNESVALLNETAESITTTVSWDAAENMGNTDNLNVTCDVSHAILPSLSLENTDVNIIEECAETVKNVNPELVDSNNELLNCTATEQSADELSHVSRELLHSTQPSITPVESDGYILQSEPLIDSLSTLALGNEANTSLKGTSEIQCNKLTVESADEDMKSNSIISKTSDSANGSKILTNEPLVSTESANTLIVTSEPLNTTVSLVTSEYSDTLLNETQEPLNATVPLVSSETADTLNGTNEPLKVTRPSVSSEHADTLLDDTNEPLNTTAPLLTSENSDTLLNEKSEPLNTNVPLVSSESSDTLNVTNEPLNVTVSSVSSEHGDTLLDATNEPLNNTVPLVTSENSDALLNEKSEPLNITVPLVSSESADILNVTVPSVSSELADTSLDATNEPVPTISSELPDTLLDANSEQLNTSEPLNTTVHLVPSESADSSIVTGELLNTSVPLITSENSDTLLKEESEPLNITVHLVSSESAGILNVTNEPLNVTVPSVSSELADSLLDATNEPLNITVPLVTSENSDALLNEKSEPLNVTVPLVSSESADKLNVTNESLNVTVPVKLLDSTNESLNTTEPLVTSENSDALLNEKSETLNITVPLVSSDSADTLNATNEPLNVTVPTISSELAVKFLDSTNEPLNTTVPLIISENSDALLNEKSEPLNVTVPLPSSESADTSIVTGELLNTTVPLVTSENSDTLLNEESEPLNTTVHLVSSERADTLNVTNEPLNVTVPSVSSKLADTVLDATSEPLNTNVPLVSSESANKLNVTNEPLNVTVPTISSELAAKLLDSTNEPLNTTVPLVTSENSDALLNEKSEPLNITVPLVSSESTDILNATSEPLNPTVPLVTCEGADTLNVISEPLNVTVPTASPEHAGTLLDAKMLLNNSVSSLTKTVMSGSCEVELSRTDEALNISVPLVVISETIERNDVTSSAIAGSAGFGIDNLSNPSSIVQQMVSSDNGYSAESNDVDKTLLNNKINDLVNTSGTSQLFSDSVATDLGKIDQAAVNVSSKPINPALPKTELNITNEYVNTPVSLATSGRDLAEVILNITTDESNDADISQLILNTKYEPTKPSDPDTSDLKEITDPVLNFEIDPVNSTVPTTVNSENGDVLKPSVTSVPSVVADCAKDVLNIITSDLINSTIMADHSENVSLNTSVPTVTLEQSSITDVVLNVTNEVLNNTVPLIAKSETVLASSINKSINPIAIVAPFEICDPPEAILNIVNDPINIKIPSVVSDNAESVLRTANFSSTKSTLFADAIMSTTKESLMTPVVSVTTDDAASSNVLNNTIELPNKKSNRDIPYEVQETINAGMSAFGTDTVENILNISSVSINVTAPQVLSEKNIDDILNISNLQFVETVAGSTSVENTKMVQDILNISNAAVTHSESASSQDPFNVLNLFTTSKSNPENVIDLSKSTEEPAPNRVKDDIYIETLENSVETSDVQKTLECIKESLIPSNDSFGKPSYDSIVQQSEDIHNDEKDVSIDFAQCLEDLENAVAPGDAYNAVALPSLELDECEIINDCNTSPEVEYFNVEALGEFLKENKRHILTPISESRENSILEDSSAFNKSKVKFDDKLNLLRDSMSNRLFSSTFDVSPINVCSPLVMQSITPITNSLTNSPIQQEKQLQSTPESVFGTATFSDGNKTFTNISDTNSKLAFCADLNLNTTHPINVDGIPKSLNETQVLTKPSLNETVTLSPFNSLDVTRTINMAEEFTRAFDKNRTLLDSTIVLDKFGELDPNATVLLTRNSEMDSCDFKNSEVINKTMKNQNINVSINERKPLSSVENNKIKLQNISEILFESNTQENMNGISSGNNKNKNMPVCVLKERSENIPENTMGAWFSTYDKNAIKLPIKSEILDSFENPVFSNAADLDIFNTDFQPPSVITGRDSLYLKFDPLYSTANNTDQTIFVTPLLKPETDVETQDVNNEDSLKKLKAEVARLHELLNQRENNEKEKLNYLKIRNEEVSIRCQIEREKLDKLEGKEKVLEDEIKNRELVTQQMNALAVSYSGMISTIEKDLQKIKEEQVDACAVKSELESSKQHLKSAEDAFLDVLAKYEKISATVPDLKANNEQKKKKISELQRESLRIDERVRYCESTLAAEMEEVRRASKLNNEQYAIETARLTAQLRKTELTHKNTKDTFDNIVVENEKLANLCDDIIAGKS